MLGLTLGGGRSKSCASSHVSLNSIESSLPISNLLLLRPIFRVLFFSKAEFFWSSELLLVISPFSALSKPAAPVTKCEGSGCPFKRSSPLPFGERRRSAQLLPDGIFSFPPEKVSPFAEPPLECADVEASYLFKQ